MWTYKTYAWPSEAAYLAMLAARGWTEGTPRRIELVVTGTVRLPDVNGVPGAPLPGWYVSAAFYETAPPPAWRTLEIEPPAGMAVIGRDPVPAFVTNFQARAALMQTPSGTPGVSLFSVIDSSLRNDKDTSPTAALAWQAWEQANDFYRSGLLINTMASQFGLTQIQVDRLFHMASTIEA